MKQTAQIMDRRTTKNSLTVQLQKLTPSMTNGEFKVHSQYHAKEKSINLLKVITHYKYLFQKNRVT